MKVRCIKIVIFLKIDVDEAEDAAEAAGVSAMPTFMFYKNCEKVDTFTGANADKLKETIDKHK